MLVLPLTFPKMGQMYQSSCRFDNNLPHSLPNHHHTASKLVETAAAVAMVVAMVAARGREREAMVDTVVQAAGSIHKTNHSMQLLAVTMVY